MGNWEKFNETTLPEKEKIYSNLNMKDITYTNYMHGKIDCKDFETKYLVNIMIFGILLLADVFKSFRKMCLKIYHLGPVKFLSAPGFPC